MNHSILVVDDEPGIRAFLTWELSSEGHEVAAAQDGVEALELIARSEFDVIISDVRMPRMDGLELLRSIKRGSPEAEVIIATGHAELEYAIECVRQGAFDFIQKPFRTESLLATVSRALERRHLRQTAGLYAASRVILDGQEPQRLPEMIIRLAMQAMDADDASLLLPQADGHLYIAHSHSLSQEVQGAVRLREGEGIAGRVASICEPVLFSNGVASDPRFSDVLCKGRVRSSIVYPLLSEKRLAGILCINRVLNEKPFRSADMERAAVLASQVLLSLENARLMRQVASSERLVSVGLLATGVAHEINNPAACVLANHSYLKDQLSKLRKLGALLCGNADASALRLEWEVLGGASFLDEFQGSLNDLGVGAFRIKEIARDMKSLGRNDEARPVLFNVNDSIRSALRMTAAELRHRVTVVTELCDGLEVMGSAGRLSQVFVNLLINSSQAIKDLNDGQMREIVVRSQQKGDHVVVSVSDDGPGIPQDHAGRIFDTFFTTKGSTVGTGLGLTISREIVQNHGGTLRLDPDSKVGATFVISIPLAASLDRKSGVIPITECTASVPHSKRFRILCIDDEPGILKAYQRALGSEHDVIIANDGADALDILAMQSDFDLIICDLMMPRVNGMGVYRRTKKTHPHLDGMFVFVTGGLSQDDVQTFVQTVGNKVLEKPFDFELLREIIHARTHSKITAIAS